MGSLGNLRLVSAKRVVAVSPVVHRREKLVKAVEDQIQLVAAMAEGRTYAPAVVRLVKDAAGLRQRVESFRRVRPWWWTANGKVHLAVRYGAKTLELAKGKNAVELSGDKELVPALNAIKTAVEQGELDLQLETAGRAAKAALSKV
jgi:hypothetical protein